MRVKRLTALIALAATALPLGQTVWSGVCAHADAAERVAVHHSPGTGHEPNHGDPPDHPAHGQDAPTCPMSGAVVTACGGSAIPTAVVFVEPAAAVISIQPKPPTFIMPASILGTDLFRPPRA